MQKTGKPVIDKAADPMSWSGRMNNFQSAVHETFYSDLIYA